MEGSSIDGGVVHAAGYGPPGGPPPGGYGPPGGAPPGGYGPPGGAPPGGYGPPGGGMPPGGMPYGGAPGFGPPGGPMAPGGFGGPGMGAPQGGFNGLAIASMVCGILAPITCCCQPVSGPLSIIALVLGILGMNKIKASNGAQRGYGMAVAGVVLGCVGLSLTGIGIFSSLDESLRGRYSSF